MILDATTKKLQIVLAAAITTNQLVVVANWVDMTTTVTTPGNTNSTTNSTTDVDIVAAPAASTQRVIQSLSVYNKDTVNATVTIKIDVSGTDSEIVKVVLQSAQSLVYTIGNGWQVVTAALQGSSKASFHANKNGTDQTGLAANTETKVTFTTEVFDIGSYYDAANSKWTPPAGKVLIGGMLFFTAGTVAAGTIEAVIYKNGAAVFYFIGTIVTTSGVQSVYVETLDDANGTDYYELYGQAGGAGTKTVDGRGTLTYFWGTAI